MTMRIVMPRFIVMVIVMPFSAWLCGFWRS
jgi:hypothetical protein